MASHQFTIPIRVVPSSNQDKIVLDMDGSITIRIRSPPRKGKANKAIIQFISKTLGVSSNNVTIVRGLRSKNKIMEITGISEDTFWKLVKK